MNAVLTRIVPAVVVAWGFSCTALAAGSNSPALINVTGEAEIKVAPDEVILTLGVETVSQDLAQAKSQNDGIVSRAMEVATGHGVEQKHIQTDYVNIEPRYRYNDREDRFLGYFVRKNMVITLRKLTEFESLLTGMLEDGVNHVHGIEFRTTELRKHRDRARVLALHAAREKAEAMAAELGRKIGSPRNITEQYNAWRSGYGGWWGGGRRGAMSQNVMQTVGGGLSSDGSATLAPGQIAVTATVSVSFELQ